MADPIIATGGPQSAPATRNTFQESREDWLVVATSTIGLAVSVMYVYSMGLFIAPLEAEFGWPRGQISAGLTVVSVITVVLAPIIGMAIDRYGSRVIALSGMVLYCLAFGLLATTSASIWHWWALWGLIGLGVVLIKPTIIRMSVVFPAPLGPSKARISPSPTETDRSSTAAIEPNRLVTRVAVTTGIMRGIFGLVLGKGRPATALSRCNE